MKKEKIIDIVFSSGISLPSYYMLEVFSTYQLGKDYNNPYLSIDRDNKKKMNKFCRVLTDSLRSKFEIEVEVFVSKKKKNCAYVLHETTNFV